MIRTIGMIGAGNMGSAILRGIVEAEYVRASQIIAFDTNRKRMRELEEDLPGVITAADCLQVAEQADLIILAVKPIFVKDVIREIRGSLQGKSVLSIAAGWTVGMLEKELQNSGATYMRVMPMLRSLIFTIRQAILATFPMCAILLRAHRLSYFAYTAANRASLSSEAIRKS